MRRVILIVETSREKDTGMLESVRVLLGSKTKDFITAVDEKNIIVVKELAANEGYKEMEQVAKNILEMLQSEGEEDVHVAYGTIVNDIKEVSKSYKEAEACTGCRKDLL